LNFEYLLGSLINTLCIYDWYHFYKVYFYTFLNKWNRSDKVELWSLVLLINPPLFFQSQIISYIVWIHTLRQIYINTIVPKVIETVTPCANMYGDAILVSLYHLATCPPTQDLMNIGHIQTKISISTCAGYPMLCDKAV
jgi:hypothetical protein